MVSKHPFWHSQIRSSAPSTSKPTAIARICSFTSRASSWLLTAASSSPTDGVVPPFAFEAAADTYDLPGFRVRIEGPCVGRQRTDPAPNDYRAVSARQACGNAVLDVSTRTVGSQGARELPWKRTTLAGSFLVCSYFLPGDHSRSRGTADRVSQQSASDGSADRTRGAAAISNAISRLHRDHYGRGATKAHTVFQRNYVIVFLEDI